MQVTIYQDETLFDALKPGWNALVDASAGKSLFSRWEWAHHWWRAYAPGQLFVMAFTVDDALVGLAPFFISAQPQSPRQLHFIGHEDVTDVMDIIVRPDHAEAVYRAVASSLREHRALFDDMLLANIPDNSATCEGFAAALREAGFEVTINQHETCPQFTLPATFEAYLESLESKQRSELRRKLRRAEGSGVMRYSIVSPQDDLQEAMQAFKHLMAASHPEKARFLQNPQHQVFFDAIVPEAMRQGWLQLIFQWVEDERVAAYLNFDYNGEILVYNSGLAPDRYGQLSPGIVLLAHTIAHAIEQGRHTFNFLRGDEAYKYQMGGKDRFLYRIQAV